VANSILSRGQIAPKAKRPAKAKHFAGMPQAMKLAKAAGPKTKGGGIYPKIARVKL